jgi:hypothetical protein
MASPAYPSPWTGQYVPVPPESKPTNAFALGIIAGILILLAGAFEVWIGAVESTIVFLGTGSTLLVVLGLLGVCLGVFVIVFSVLLYLQTEHHVVYGVIILVLSIASALAYWGFVLGMVLGIVAGVLAIVWMPVRWTPIAYGPMGPGGWPTAPAPFSASSHRVCLKCGRLVGIDSRYCSYCGAPVAP